MNIQYENKELCKQCGGKCCKKCGCDYLPKDFNDLSTNGLVEKILEGSISIVSTLTINKLPNGGGDNNFYITIKRKKYKSFFCRFTFFKNDLCFFK